jgi:hypothetical protein
MLAYVFWHTRRPEVAVADYRARLADFHESLRRSSPPGFQASCTFQHATVPWLAAAGETYEDWYLLDGSAALDVLNDAAVSAPLRAPHDAAARAADSGTAGLYRLRLGEAAIARARSAQWLAKPAGMSYDALYDALDPVLVPGAGLWCRQMVLGPTPELCVLAPRPVALPGGMQPLQLTPEVVWPSGSWDEQAAVGRRRRRGRA